MLPYALCLSYHSNTEAVLFACLLSQVDCLAPRWETALIACLHDQNKSGLFGGPVLFIQSEQSEKFLKSPGWLKKRRPSKKPLLFWSWCLSQRHSDARPHCESKYGFCNLSITSPALYQLNKQPPKIFLAIRENCLSL